MVINVSTVSQLDKRYLVLHSHGNLSNVGHHPKDEHNLMHRAREAENNGNCSMRLHVVHQNLKSKQLTMHTSRFHMAVSSIIYQK